MKRGLRKIKDFSAFHGKVRAQRGVTLLELLVVMAIFVVVIAAVYALYNTQLKITHIEEDVAEVQQNLRVAMDIVSKDVAMAGIAVDTGTNAVGGFTNNLGVNGSDTLTFNSGSADGVLTIIDSTLMVAVVSGAPITFTVGSANEVSMFSVGDGVRIVNSAERAQPADTAFTVTAINTATPSLTLIPTVSCGNVKFMRGCLVSKVGSSGLAPYPNTVRYCLGPSADCAPAVTKCPSGQNCLMRIVNETPVDTSVIATNIEGLQFGYILDNTGATETDTPGSLAIIRAVRVTIVGETFKTAGLSRGAKSRELTNIVKLRNR